MVLAPRSPSFAFGSAWVLTLVPSIQIIKNRFRRSSFVLITWHERQRTVRHHHATLVDATHVAGEATRKAAEQACAQTVVVGAQA